MTLISADSHLFARQLGRNGLNSPPFLFFAMIYPFSKSLSVKKLDRSYHTLIRRLFKQVVWCNLHSSHCKHLYLYHCLEEQDQNVVLFIRCLDQKSSCGCMLWVQIWSPKKGKKRKTAPDQHDLSRWQRAVGLVSPGFHSIGIAHFYSKNVSDCGCPIRSDLRGDIFEWQCIQR